MKKRTNLITLVAAVAISLAGIVWWFANGVGIVSNILYPPDYSVSKPIHLFFSGNNSYGLIRGSQYLTVSQFSISFWIKNDGDNHNSFSRPIKMLQRITKGTVSIPYGWAFDTGNASQIGNNQLRFTVGSTTGRLIETDPVSLSSDYWTHIVGIFDGANLKLYKGHLLVQTVPLKGMYAYPPAPIPILIGTSLLPHKSWEGYLADIEIYGRPLTQAEINSIFKGKDISNGLIGRWKLNEGSGNAILDSSRNGNNGILHNVIWK